MANNRPRYLLEQTKESAARHKPAEQFTTLRSCYTADGTLIHLQKGTFHHRILTPASGRYIKLDKVHTHLLATEDPRHVITYGAYFPDDQDDTVEPYIACALLNVITGTKITMNRVHYPDRDVDDEHEDGHILQTGQIHAACNKRYFVVCYQTKTTCNEPNGSMLHIMKLNSLSDVNTIHIPMTIYDVRCYQGDQNALLFNTADKLMHLDLTDFKTAVMQDDINSYALVWCRKRKNQR